MDTSAVETFVIRLWTPTDRPADAERLAIRGFVEHVQGGERTAFCGSGELLAFLELFLPPHAEGGGEWPDSAPEEP